MAKLDKRGETILRKQVRIAQETIEECQKLLVEGGCEPEPSSAMRTSKVIAVGLYARAKNAVKDVGTSIADFSRNTEKAGEGLLAEREMDKAVEEEMKKVKEQLHKAVGA